MQKDNRKHLQPLQGSDVGVYTGVMDARVTGLEMNEESYPIS